MTTRQQVRVLLAVGLVSGAIIVQPIAGQVASVVDSESRPSWVDAHRASAIDSLMPPPASDEDIEPNSAWVAVMRVSPTHAADPELYVRLTKLQTGKLTARVVRPAGGSIQDQLARIHLRNPSLALHDAIRLVEMRTINIDDMRSPTLRRVARTLEATRGQYVFENLMVLDATHYELWTIGGPQRTHISLLGPDRGNPQLPLLRALLAIRTFAESLP